MNIDVTEASNPMQIEQKYAETNKDVPYLLYNGILSLNMFMEAIVCMVF